MKYNSNAKHWNAVSVMLNQGAEHPLCSVASAPEPVVPVRNPLIIITSFILCSSCVGLYFPIVYNLSESTKFASLLFLGLIFWNVLAWVMYSSYLWLTMVFYRLFVCFSFCCHYLIFFLTLASSFGFVLPSMHSNLPTFIMMREGLIAINRYIALLDSKLAFKICFPPLIYKYFNQ